jgi:hypothetical protein
VTRATAIGLSVAAFLAAAPLRAADPAPSRPLEISVDATEAPRKLLHARLVIPAAPGPLTLHYPKWIPGEHFGRGSALPGRLPHCLEGQAAFGQARG